MNETRPQSRAEIARLNLTSKQGAEAIREKGNKKAAEASLFSKLDLDAWEARKKAEDNRVESAPGVEQAHAEPTERTNTNLSYEQSESVIRHEAQAKVDVRKADETRERINTIVDKPKERTDTNAPAHRIAEKINIGEINLQKAKKNLDTTQKNLNTKMEEINAGNFGVFVFRDGTIKENKPPKSFIERWKLKRRRKKDDYQTKLLAFKRLIKNMDLLKVTLENVNEDQVNAVQPPPLLDSRYLREVKPDPKPGLRGDVKNLTKDERETAEIYQTEINPISSEDLRIRKSLQNASNYPDAQIIFGRMDKPGLARSIELIDKDLTQGTNFLGLDEDTLKQAKSAVTLAQENFDSIVVENRVQTPQPAEAREKSTTSKFVKLPPPPVVGIKESDDLYGHIEPPKVENNIPEPKILTSLKIEDGLGIPIERSAPNDVVLDPANKTREIKPEIMDNWLDAKDTIKKVMALSPIQNQSLDKALLFLKKDKVKKILDSNIEGRELWNLRGRLIDISIAQKNTLSTSSTLEPNKRNDVQNNLARLNEIIFIIAENTDTDELFQDEADITNIANARRGSSIEYPIQSSTKKIPSTELQSSDKVSLNTTTGETKDIRMPNELRSKIKQIESININSPNALDAALSIISLKEVLDSIASQLTKNEAMDLRVILANIVKANRIRLQNDSKLTYTQKLELEKKIEKLDVIAAETVREHLVGVTYNNVSNESSTNKEVNNQQIEKATEKIRTVLDFDPKLPTTLADVKTIIESINLHGQIFLPKMSGQELNRLRDTLNEVIIEARFLDLPDPRGNRKKDFKIVESFLTLLNQTQSESSNLGDRPISSQERAKAA
jgi:hypothetical protein